MIFSSTQIVGMLEINNKYFMKTTDLAHYYWKERVQPGDILIDATCGNGQDTLFLAHLLQEESLLLSYDIQEEALKKTSLLLQKELSKEKFERVHLKCLSHENFEEKKAHLIVYNLGYLPGGDKTLTTQAETTLKSLNSACKILASRGMISIVLYSGHPEGEKEEELILSFAASLPSHQWSALHHRWMNRKKAPSLLLLFRE